MSSPPRPLTYAEIDLDAIAHNVQQIKHHIGPDVALFAVVKANAYGHGALDVTRTALQHGADRLAVARVLEGVALRQAGITAPILVMSHALGDEIALAAEHDLTLAVIDMETVTEFAQQARERGKRATMHIKVDTGMGRYGLLPDEVLPFVEQAAPLPGLDIEGIFSHFAVADAADKTYTRQQFATFQHVMDQLDAAGYAIPLRHIANSAATLDLPAMHLDAVRTGIALYGLWPSDEVEPVISLKPALSLKSHVARVRTLPAGASISYGRTFITPHAMPVALVPVGYGDGYHRILSNRGAVLIHGQRAPVVGRVCMDQFVVDVSQIEQVQAGDEVVILGRQGEAQITAEEIARWAETINYEVTTSLLSRVTRFYRYEGEWLPDTTVLDRAP